MNRIDLSAENLLSTRTLTEIQEISQQLIEKCQRKQRSEAVVYADLALSLMCRDSLRRNSRNQCDRFP